MPEQQFYCPQCKTRLDKTTPEYVLGKAGSFVVSGETHRSCPRCGFSIDRREIIKGTYDQGPRGGNTGCFVMLAILVILIASMIYHG